MSESWEHFSSPELTRTNKDEKASTTWIVRADDEASALAEAELKTPLALSVGVNVAIRQQVKVKPLGGNLFEASAEYGNEDDPKSDKPQEPGEWKYSFDTTGGKHKLSIGKKNRQRQWAWSASNPAPDLFGAINFDGKKVAGVEIVVPNLEFTLTVLYNPAAVTVAFVQELARKTGRMNNDKWLGFEPGEALFLGARGDGALPTIRGQRTKPVAIQFFYAASENRDVVIGSNPDPLKKRGFDYLWVRYERVESNGLDYPVPVHAYVEQVYDELSFKGFFKFG